VLADDPSLTVRHVVGRDPIRAVLDADLRTPEDAAVLGPKDGSGADVLIFHAEHPDESRRDALRRAGAELIPVSRHARGVDVAEVLEVLGSRDVVRLLVEGGAHVHGTFLDLGLADRAAIFIAPRIVGDAGALSFAAGTGVESIDKAWRLAHTELRTFGSDWLVTGDFERMQ
jgi:diaminohydroxyphosphoribosylaminopyrimidine deaminase/5-amino-6-(5-phosphoribosylamino)uracil reductase